MYFVFFSEWNKTLLWLDVGIPEESSGYPLFLANVSKSLQIFKSLYFYLLLILLIGHKYTFILLLAHGST